MLRECVDSHHESPQAKSSPFSKQRTAASHPSQLDGNHGQIKDLAHECAGFFASKLCMQLFASNCTTATRSKGGL